MSKVKETKKQILSKINAIKKISDDDLFQKLSEKTEDKFLKDLPSLDGYQSKLSSFLSKNKKKVQEKSNIFQDLIDVSDLLLKTKSKVDGSDKLVSVSRLKLRATESVNETIKSSKKIVMDNVKQVFFAGDGICGGNNKFTGSQMDSVTIKPKEIDFFKILTTSPTSNTGKIMYELPVPDKKKIKLNVELYNQFNSVTPYSFITPENNTLFDVKWSGDTQEFVISGLTQGSTVEIIDFLNDYYSSIEFPDISGITKTALMMTINGDSSENPLISDAFNKMNRLLEKILSKCGNKKKKNDLQQNAVNQFNEQDEDLEFYFNFDDVEGIDLDDEDARLRKVLRFKDCNNFEIPTSKSNFEDFVYLSSKKNLTDLVDSTINNVALDAYEQSDSSINLDLFQISLNKAFILNLPKALISALLSPKIFLPIVIVYKLIKKLANTVLGIFDDAETLMKNLKKLFSGIIRDLFWKFITEFWKRIKVDLLNFLKSLISGIIKSKLKKYRLIVTSLIAFLQKIPTVDLKSCQDLFSLILKSITDAINSDINLKIPNPLLMMAPFRSGFSEERAMIGVIENLESIGVPTGDINGESNDFVSSLFEYMKAVNQEMNTNGKSVGVNSLPIAVINGPAGGFIPPMGLNITTINSA